MDATILEVGIGGLLDDTNIVPRPVVTGVSSIGYDHMSVLGYSLREIATQKGGIFKARVSPSHLYLKTDNPAARYPGVHGSTTSRGARSAQSSSASATGAEVLC